MTANSETLEKITSTVRTELPKYLPAEAAIYDVFAQNRPGPDDEDYVHVRVVLEDDHPRLDPQNFTKFSLNMRNLLEQSGIDHDPIVSYANRGELNL